MNNIISGALLYFFACLGLYTAIIQTARFFARREKRWFDNVTVILSVKGREEGIEYMLRSLVSYTDMITDGRGRPEILVVDTGMERETAAICGKFNKVKVCGSDEICDIMRAVVDR